MAIEESDDRLVLAALLSDVDALLRLFELPFVELFFVASGAANFSPPDGAGAPEDEGSESRTMGFDERDLDDLAADEAPAA